MFIEKKSKKVEYKVSRKYYVHVLCMNIKKTIYVCLFPCQNMTIKSKNE